MPKLLRSTLLVLLSTFGFIELQAQNIFWTDVTESSFRVAETQKSTITPVKFRSFIADTIALKSALQTAPKEFTEAARTSPLILSLPMPDGSIGRFAVVYSPMMEPELEAKFPNIRTYSGQGIDDKTATLKMDWTDFGLHVQVLSPNSSSAFYIDPYARGEKTQYMAYQRKDLPLGNRQFIEQAITKEIASSVNAQLQRGAAGLCYGTQLRTYRTAVACTGEYAVAIGGSSVTASQVLSTVTSSINRVNGIYETELSVRLTLVANNNLILYTNSTTDPFTGNNNASTLVTESQTEIDSKIGTASYDLGHTFSTGAGGYAPGNICNNSNKAQGVTGSPFPLGDAYDVDFVAHEMGHQLGGSHTFNGTTDNCGGGTRYGPTAVEPGSGITIMGYAGICGINDLADHSIPYFHAISQNQIVTNINGAGCGTLSNTGNSIPVVNSGANYTIPKSTPFVLTGSATDLNNSEVLSYSWEEIDAGTSGGNWNSGSKPYFRSFNPTTSPTRYFPKLSTLAAEGTGNLTIGEYLPGSAQTLNFRLTARDNRSGGGGVCSADMTVTVNGATGPFDVTSQWGVEIWTANGTNQQTITWNVAGTSGSPINCSNVSILFSTDGGLTFPYTLIASTANDGSEAITVPNLKTSKGRIMVKAVGNIFFDINDADITINSSCNAVGATVSPASSVSARAGNSALNLNLSPTYSSFIPAGTIVQTDAQTDLILRNTSGGACISFINRSRYQSHTFSVTTTGTYTFTFTSGSTALQAWLHSGSFNDASPCTGVLAMSGSYTSGTYTPGSSVSASLTAGNTYVLTIGTFSDASPAIPASYRMSVTPPAGGVAYLIGQQYTNPGAGFNYTYVIVKNSTGNIVAISSTADLTNSTTYPAGQYTVYGLSYSTAISNLSSYVGGSFTALANQIVANPSTFCADLSKNSVTVNVTGTFPVQFTVLKARKQGEKVLLDWGTVTEQNSNYFGVQRSANGSEFNTQIGSVKAAGNSNSELKYNFIDVTPLKGWNYYRIKQVDLDGKFTYSNIAAVNFDRSNGLMLIYPNPAKDQLNIEYTSERGGKLELQVIDSKGAVVMNKTLQITTGRNFEIMNISNLSKGAYMLKYIDADGNISFTKFVKQ